MPRGGLPRIKLFQSLREELAALEAESKRPPERKAPAKRRKRP